MAFMEHDPWWAVQYSPPLKSLVKECVEAKELANRRPKYVKELRRSLGKFLIGREDCDPRQISPATIEQWFAAAGFSGATRCTMICRLGALFSFAKKRGYIEHNPVTRIDRPIIERKPPRILSPEEAIKLLNFAGRVGLFAYVVIGLFGGVRPAEMERLTWDDVDVHRGIVCIDAATSKVRRRRIIHLEPAGRAWLERADITLPISPKQKQKRLRRLACHMGWEVYHHDILRHSGASYLLALHRDAARVALMLGNSPGVLLSRYYELVSDEDQKKFWSVL